MEGILPLWKERGMTSHDCVFKLRKILQTKKIGHTGTLDPDVDGVLPICIGRATKVVEYMVDSGKAYVGEITLGFSTTTEDSSGEMVARQNVEEPILEEKIDEAMACFVGEITQIPPMYSAVKVNGKRLYEYARAGETVERPERKAIIDQFVRTSTPLWNKEEKTVSWKFEVACGKGTYVRTLAVDLGEKLGYPAHMSDLTRTSSGKFHISDCLTLAQVAELMEKDQIAEKLAPLEYGLSAFSFVSLDDKSWEKVKNGGLLLKKEYAHVNCPFVVTYHDQACAIYDIHPSKPDLLKPVKVLKNQID